MPHCFEIIAVCVSLMALVHVSRCLEVTSAALYAKLCVCWNDLNKSRSFKHKKARHVRPRYVKEVISLAGRRTWIWIPLVDNDDVIRWKHFPRNWSFVRGIHRSPVNSPRKGQWRGELMFLFLICAWINGWVNNREVGDLRRHHTHYDVTVMMHNDKYIRFYDYSMTYQIGCLFMA